jgi:hypothetical protein
MLQTLKVSDPRLDINEYKKKQSRYRPGVTQRVPGS